MARLEPAINSLALSSLPATKAKRLRKGARAMARWEPAEASLRVGGSNPDYGHGKVWIASAYA